MTAYDTVDHGEFVRNLTSDDVKRRYQDDDLAEYGFRIHQNAWDERQCRDGLSVNALQCLPDVVCSIMLHPEYGQYHHVVCIDLTRLRNCLAMSIVAQYDPIESSEEFPNPAHFLLLPEDQPIEAFIIALRGFMENDFPKRKNARKPTTEADRALAVDAMKRYEEVFRIHRGLR